MAGAAPDRAADRGRCAFDPRRALPVAQRVIGLTILATLVVVSIAMLVEVDTNGTLVAEAGGWPGPMGITLVADRFAAVLVLVAEVMLLAVLVYAIGEPGAERNHVGFQSAYLILAAGVAASFLTGDLFNLFVAFELMLTASYVLLTLGGGGRRAGSPATAGSAPGRGSRRRRRPRTRRARRRSRRRAA